MPPLESKYESDLSMAKKSARDDSASSAIERRQFLAVLGTSFSALGLSGCGFRAPEEKIVPYLQQPIELTPGIANWYASTCAGCPARCGTLVKNRDGRPIKMEGNPSHPLSRGGLCARGQATVLDLYDSTRLPGPLKARALSWWEEVDASVIDALAAIRDRKGQIRILSSTVSSPTVRRAIKQFTEAYPTTKHVMYDATSASAILDAHERSHGLRTLPSYDFAQAKVIVSFDADFLGSWISPVEFTRDYTQGRDLREGETNMSRHIHFEARMSPTGANADLRITLRPSEVQATLAHLARLVVERLNIDDAAGLAEGPESSVSEVSLAKIADELVRAKGAGLVVSGSEDVSVQIIVNALNAWLENYGTTLDLLRPSLQYAGNDAELATLTAEMAAGDIAALIVYDCNPAYDHVEAQTFRLALGKVALTVSLSGREDETAALAAYVCPDHHEHETWGDANPRLGVYSMNQPTIAPLYNTRAAVETFTTWAGEASAAYDLLQTVWDEEIFSQLENYDSFTQSWTESVQRGVMIFDQEHGEQPSFNSDSLDGLVAESLDSAAGAFEFVAFESVALARGRQANNPWLQELPDPITKAGWGNCASMSPASAQTLGVKEGQVVELSSGGQPIRLPAHIQLGMANGVVAVALGYGRNDAGMIAANFPTEKMFPLEKELLAGADVYPLSRTKTVTLVATSQFDALAKTQSYDHEIVPFTGHDRNPARGTTLAEYQQDAHAGNEEHHEEGSLWPGHPYEGHHWGMVIDLNRCTGCSACLVGCQAENNVPVVGKVEMRKNRVMHWLRLDRYYSGTPDAPEENPTVSFQPMLCQQCDNAPCETVCPVLATTHSSEGLNMQVYNRCVGTKYCANNCPYKVRRFNWYDYAHDDLVQNLVLNPDVTVRPRGVMEKCTFCVQRIYGAKREAQRDGRTLADGDIQPACAQSCPASAIDFGDMNNPESRVAQLAKSPRGYKVLEELGVLPSVTYLTSVRNTGDDTA